MSIVSKDAIRVMLIKNELGGNLNKAYKISHAGGKSGYSFGQPQWDLAQQWKASEGKRDEDQAPAWRTFLDIIETQISDPTKRKRIIDKVKNPFPTLNIEEINLINQALSSNYGRWKIDDAFEKELDIKLTRLNGLLDELRANGKIQIADYIENNHFMQMALVDYDNHLYIRGIDGYGEEDGLLMRYLKGEKVELGYGKKVQIRGEFGLEDYLIFYLNTQEGQERPNILIRRFSNILEEVGVNNIQLTQDDLSFLLFELENLLGKKYRAIILNPDNWGIRNLISKAYALWGDRSVNLFGIDYWQRLQMNNVIPVQFQSFITAKTTPPPRVGIPIILDLDGDGVETTNVTDGAYFDHDANGFAEKTGWAGSDDGLLAWDRNGDGIINDGRELFNDPIGFPGMTNGFQVLSALDGNKDGRIDFMDSVWSQLRVWRDWDGDGYSGADELWSLSDLGIVSINTSYTSSTYIDPQGNEHRQVGSFTWSDGRTGTATDVTFKVEKMHTIANEWLDVPADIAILPDLQGFGNVYDLHQAMVRDTSGQLKALVQQFIVTTDPIIRNILMEQILFKWTESDGISPTSRGPNIDARRLAVLERFFGEAFVGVGGSNPNVNAGALLNQSYRGMFEMFYAGLMAQSHLKEIYNRIIYSWDESTQSLRGDLSAIKTELENHYAKDPISGKSLLEEFVRTVKGFDAGTILNLDTLRDNEIFCWVIDSYGFSSKIEGTDANDSLAGTTSSDAIRGGGGNDIILGGDGNDLLYGQSGDDFWMVVVVRTPL